MRRNLVAGILIAGVLASAQSFEVASIKPNTSGSGSSHSSPDGLQLHMTNMSLKRLIELGWDLQEFQLSAPDWLATTHFDIAATMPPNTNRGPLVQNLLAERFGLHVHHETKELTGYALVVLKGGLKVKESVSPHGTNVHENKGHLVANGISMKDLGETLARDLGRPVRDVTKLDGKYEVTLDWTPDDQVSGSGPDISIFTAVQEQLGLKLESRKVTADVLVVDHIERTPTEN